MSLKTIVFDANFGQPWVVTLTNFFSLHKNPPLLQHVHAIAGADAGDEDWIPKLKTLNCIIITADAGGKPQAHPPLPRICKQCNKTHIILSGSVHSENKFQKARAIVSLWPDIIEVFNAPAGSRYKLHAMDATHKHFKLSLKELCEKPEQKNKKNKSNIFKPINARRGIESIALHVSPEKAEA